MAVKFVTLVLNDECNEVRMAQEMLRECGSKVTANGKFTIGTRSAVVSFQKKNNLPVTGKIDRKTWDKLVVMTKTVKRKARPAKKPAGKK